MIPTEQPPDSTDLSLRSYLTRMFQAIANELLKSRYEPRKDMPAKFGVGDIYYFAGSIPSTAITGEGLWIYKSTGWVQII